MFLFQAEGRNFRNYKNFSLSLEKPLSFFTGNNGEGKTSILEAIFLGLRGKSFKPGQGPNFIKEGERQAFIRLSFNETEGQSFVESHFEVKEGQLSRELRYCGKKVSRSFLEKKFPLLFWIGEKLESIKGGSSEKRKLLDEMLLFEGQRDVVEKFQRCLREKNSLLWNFKKGICSKREAYQTLEALNVSFLKASIDLTEKRMALLEKVFPKASGIFPTHQNLDYRYEIEGRILKHQEERERLLQEALSNKVIQELEAGRVLFGPGKHDILFLFNGKDSRVFCSQGQQRIFVLSLLMAQALFFKKPLVFLDDVLSELDERTVKKLLFFLEETGCQVFITNCKKIDINLKKMSFFDVKNGTINP